MNAVPSVKTRLFQAISHNLGLDDRGSTQRHLGLLHALRLAPDRQNASLFVCFL